MMGRHIAPEVSCQVREVKMMVFVGACNVPSVCCDSVFISCGPAVGIHQRVQILMQISPTRGAYARKWQKHGSNVLFTYVLDIRCDCMVSCS